MNNFIDQITIILDLNYSKYINKKLSNCIYNNCMKIACFNYNHTKKRLYCNKHKLDSMVNINDIKRTCIIENCSTRAIYNYYAEKKPLYCNKHKLENMINITDKKCININCNKIPIYNYENINTPIYCTLHKLENMIDVHNRNKICQYDNCNIRAFYNYKNNKKAIYCYNHKLENMIDILHKVCIFEDCNIRPIFNYKNTKSGLYCNKHKLDNMIDIVNNKLFCKLCKRVRSDKNLDNLCSGCFYFTYPNHVTTRNHKTKENQIISDLNKEFNNIIIQDKIIAGGCSKRRPDGLIRLNDYNIIIEIDEHQHIDYDCENKRLMMLFQDLGNAPLTVIRFNPDKYKKNNETIKSPFGITKVDGKLKIINKKEYNIRLKKLIEIINDNMINVPEKECNIIQLFYNS
jgi:hypothetical protein